MAKKVIKGKLITFEGSEGSGKSTQIKRVYAYLKKKNFKVILLREPGGTSIGENIRSVLLNAHNKNMSQACETLLYMAARAQLVKEVILPFLGEGKIVLCDRFLDSTRVYQGYGHGIALDLINQMGDFATEGVIPDLTFVFDIDVEQGLARIKRAKDRIERRSLSYHKRVRHGYLALVQAEPHRVKLIVGDQDKVVIFKHLQTYIDNLLGIEKTCPS